MTDRFKEKCNESANCDRLGKIIYEENEIRYDGNLASLELVEDCYVNGTIIGTTNTKGITINTIGSETLYEKEIQAQIGIKYDDTDEEYINLGKYTIDKPSATETANLGQYKGYDYLDKLNADYKCSYTDFDSITVADILQDLCNQCGLEITSLEFENNDFPVSGNIFENYKCKDVLSDILELASSFGTIDKETNKLTFKQLGKESVVTLTKDNYSVLTKNQVYGPINSFTVKESQIEGENISIQDDESIETHGENMFAIVDNMFCYTPELRKRALDSIWKNIKGLTYVDCRIESYTGLPYLNAGDKITVEDDDGNFFDTYVLKHTFTYDGTFKSVIESPALTKQQNAIKSDVSLREKLNQTVINVYKDKKQIEALVTESSETTEKLTKFEMDLDSIKQQVSEIDDFTKDGETIDGNLNLNDIGNGYLLNLKIRPKDEHVAPTFPNFTIYPGESTFTRDGLSIVRIKNLTTGSFTDYEIPVDLYYKDENTFDVLEYQYGSDKCTVTKKLKMVDGVLTEMESPVSTEYDFPVIDTTDGTYSISLLNYDQAYIYAKMIGKNDFSDTFALKRELSSAITQTKEYIQTEVKNLSTQVNGDIENLSSSITQTAEKIESDVSSYKKTIDGEITELNSKITQTASSFTTEINNHKKAVDGEISDLDSKITQTANSITSDVNSKIQGVNGDIEELSSKIEQTATSITNSVNGQIKDINGNITNLSASLELKLNTKDLCSELNASADKITFKSNRFSWTSTNSSMSEDGTLKASNVDLSGKITATSGSIGGFGLTSNSFTAQINYTFPTITDSDMNKIRQYLLGTGSLTPDEKTKYDFNGDGKIDSWDLQVANQLKAGVIPYNFVGNFKLNTNDPKETITLTSNSGIFDTKIGLIHGVSSKIGNFTNLTCSNLNCSSISMLSNISNMSIVTGSKNYLEVRDSSNAWGIDMWASDKRLKENIKESVYNALEKILAIEHKEFDYKNGGHVKIGYIADELEIIDPDFIFEVGEEKMKQPQISTIIPVITKAIQEQEQEILKLREELLILKKDV